MARFCLRISDEIMEQIHWAVAERGLQSPSALIRQAIYERLSKDVHRIQTVQQAEHSLIDSFVKLFLICVPEPLDDEFQLAKARAAARYNSFLRNVARNMTENPYMARQQLDDDDGY
jgi:hypothetical protein